MQHLKRLEIEHRFYYEILENLPVVLTEITKNARNVIFPTFLSDMMLGRQRRFSHAMMYLLKVVLKSEIKTK